MQSSWSNDSTDLVLLPYVSNRQQVDEIDCERCISFCLQCNSLGKRSWSHGKSKTQVYLRNNVNRGLSAGVSSLRDHHLLSILPITILLWTGETFLCSIPLSGELSHSTFDFHSSQMICLQGHEGALLAIPCPVDVIESIISRSWYLYQTLTFMTVSMIACHYFKCIYIRLMTVVLAFHRTLPRLSSKCTLRGEYGRVRSVSAT